MEGYLPRVPGPDVGNRATVILAKQTNRGTVK
jgi:hypothetical protein